MNKKPSVTVVAALLFVNACGPRVGVPETSVGGVVDASTTSTHVGEALVSSDGVTVDSTIATTTQAAVDESPSAEGESVESAAASERPATSPVVPASSTTTTAASSVPETTTTTQPPAEVDLDALNQALNELDALLGLFDSQIDAVDLDETEGETP